MTQLINSLTEILGEFDVAVLDQWGVLHDGSTPYPSAVAAMAILRRANRPMFILSNSGKRAELNRRRIESRGFAVHDLKAVVTSGEALWTDICEGRLRWKDKVLSRFFPICGADQDAENWADGAAEIQIVDRISEDVDALLLMGIPDATPEGHFDTIFAEALRRELPVVCSNPDRTSPRSHGLVTSPGALADRFREFGGHVIWYGKPYSSVFDAVLRASPDVPPERFLMIGDSLEHDIAGAHASGFRSLLVRGGIHSDAFVHARSDSDVQNTISALCNRLAVQSPEFSLDYLA